MAKRLMADCLTAKRRAVVSLALLLPAAVVLSVPAGAQSTDAGASSLAAPPNPYRLKPFQADFPTALEYPVMQGLEYEKTRRQVLRQLANNLQGNVRREAWLLATEFFWRAPEDAVDPLLDAMDNAMGNPALADAVRNCVEAMGKMANPEFDAPLKRALRHKHPAVQQAAYAALGSSGSTATVLELEKSFLDMNGRSRKAWMRAVRKRLPEQRVAIFKKIMVANYPPQVRDELLEQIAFLPAEEAAIILKPRFAIAVEKLQAIIAGVLHAAGDGVGTAWLLDALQGEDLARLELAIRHCAFGEDRNAAIGDLREHLLRATTHLRPEVRRAAAWQLTGLEGDDVADIFEVLAADDVWEVRGVAIRELTRRGRNQFVTTLLEELPTATGTRVRSIINQLSASGDPRAVPVLLERLERATSGGGSSDGRALVQALAQNSSDAAAKALFDLVAGPERIIAGGTDEPLTTRTYLPLLLLNLRGTERVVLERFQALPKENYAARSLLLPVLIGYATDRTDQPELQKDCIEPVRKILFDREDLPQLRVQALNGLARNWLTVADALRLKRQRYDEQPGIRALWADFLNQTF
ncbi:MAG: HEAT repeat domain-containing protein [Planctomycetota bacterium]